MAQWAENREDASDGDFKGIGISTGKCSISLVFLFYKERSQKLNLKPLGIWE